jgi:hypothetical protein
VLQPREVNRRYRTRPIPRIGATECAIGLTTGICNGSPRHRCTPERSFHRQNPRKAKPQRTWATGRRDPSQRCRHRHSSFHSTPPERSHPPRKGLACPKGTRASLTSATYCVGSRASPPIPHIRKSALIVPNASNCSVVGQKTGFFCPLYIDTTPTFCVDRRENTPGSKRLY